MSGPGDSGEPVTGSARGEQAAHILDLSLGGALLRLQTPFEVGSIHDFALQLGSETVWVQAEIRRSSPAARGDGFDVGVLFVGIDPQHQRVLKEYLAHAHRA